jgi:hypothetical protein
MRRKFAVRHALLILSLTGAATLVESTAAQDSMATAAPSVFAGEAPLELTIRTDIRTLLRDRGQNRRDHDGIARFARSDGSVDSIPVELRTRGIFRRRPSVCSFPPLRLTIRPRAARGTPFEGERRIKLVTHCRPSDQYEQYVLQEYLIYRVYALLSDLSLRTRLARITYEDATGKDKPVTRYAILLEDDRRLAERHRMRLVADTGTAIARLDPVHTVFVAVFQYFIGNTDWSVRALHNIVLLEDSLRRFLMVPYDFDWSGVIGTRYAHPDTSLPISTVQERLYAGYCGPLEDFEQFFARFRQHRAAIEALYDLEPLERGHRERARRYYDDFFRLIDDPRRIRREMLGRCR